MNKLFFLNLLFLGSSLLNLLAIDGEQLKVIADTSVHDNLKILDRLQQKIKNANLPYKCRNDLYQLVKAKNYPLIDVFKPREQRNKEFDKIITAQDANDINFLNQVQNIENLVNEIRNLIHESPVATNCKNLLYQAEPRLRPDTSK